MVLNMNSEGIQEDCSKPKVGERFVLKSDKLSLE